MPTNSLIRGARGMALGVTGVLGHATSGLRMLPGFLIVGAQRSGTTSLFKTLIQHPAVAPPLLRKGVHYFDTGYDRGHSWYRGQFPVHATARLRRRSGAGPITGESSPFYSFHPLSIGRIARDLPEVRLIMLLRDPVERAYSAHSHESARGFETETFVRALELEPERLAGERERMIDDPQYVSYDLQHHGYLARGRYIEQLRAIETAVGRDRTLALDAQDFFEDPEPVFGEVLEHLGLPWVDGIRFEQHNARRRSPMAESLREELRSRFDDTDRELAQWWGRTPSWRR